MLMPRAWHIIVVATQSVRLHYDDAMVMNEYNNENHPGLTDTKSIIVQTYIDSILHQKIEAKQLTIA